MIILIHLRSSLRLHVANHRQSCSLQRFLPTRCLAYLAGLFDNFLYIYIVSVLRCGTVYAPVFGNCGADRSDSFDYFMIGPSISISYIARG